MSRCSLHPKQRFLIHPSPYGSNEPGDWTRQENASGDLNNIRKQRCSPQTAPFPFYRINALQRIRVSRLTLVSLHQSRETSGNLTWFFNQQTLGHNLLWGSFCWYENALSDSRPNKTRSFMMLCILGRDVYIEFHDVLNLVTMVTYLKVWPATTKRVLHAFMLFWFKSVTGDRGAHGRIQDSDWLSIYWFYCVVRYKSLGRTRSLRTCIDWLCHPVLNLCLIDIGR